MFTNHGNFVVQLSWFLTKCLQRSDKVEFYGLIRTNRKVFHTQTLEYFSLLFYYCFSTEISLETMTDWKCFFKEKLSCLFSKCLEASTTSMSGLTSQKWEFRSDQSLTTSIWTAMLFAPWEQVLLLSSVLLTSLWLFVFGVWTI